MHSDTGQLAVLAELGTAVWSNRHHHVTVGAGHDEIRAVRAAAAARSRGMSYADIASAMHLSAADITAWLGPENQNRSEET